MSNFDEGVIVVVKTGTTPHLWNEDDLFEILESDEETYTIRPIERTKYGFDESNYTSTVPNRSIDERCKRVGDIDACVFIRGVTGILEGIFGAGDQR